MLRPCQPWPMPPTFPVRTANARAGFLAAAAAARRADQHYAHPLTGPEGEELAIDVAELGPADADDVVVVVSGTHGVEGYCGSALQLHWLEHHADERPADVRGRPRARAEPVRVRVGAPGQRGQRRPQPQLRRLDATAAAQRRLRAHGRAPGARATGPGRAGADDCPSCSRSPRRWASKRPGRRQRRAVPPPHGRVLRRHRAGVVAPVAARVERRHASPGRERVAIIDLHTGLGPWGHGELITSEPPDSDRVPASGVVVARDRVDGRGRQRVGLTRRRLAGGRGRVPPRAEVTAIAIEYGTVDGISVRRRCAPTRGCTHTAIRAARGRRRSAPSRAAFADDDPAWIEACWPRYDEVVGLAVTHLTWIGPGPPRPGLGSTGCHGANGASTTSTMRWTIDHAAPERLQDQIAACVRRGMAGGELRLGDQLPPAAELGDALDVNRNTVLAAYRQLRDEGVLEFRRGRGVRIGVGRPGRRPGRRRRRRPARPRPGPRARPPASSAS